MSLRLSAAQKDDAGIAMQSQPGERNRYWPALDGLRALAFLFVFCHHVCPTTPAADHSAQGLVLKIFSWGWSGVDLFFVLSGFLISYLLLQERKSFGTISIKDFYMRRVLRIWPLYYLILGTLAVIPLLYGSQLHMYLYRHLVGKVIGPYALFIGNYSILNAGTAVQDLCQSLKINVMFYITLTVPLWSLCIEEQFYAVWPWILKALKRPTALWIVCTSVVLLSVCTRLSIFMYAFSTNQGNEYYRYNTFCHLDALMFGAMLALAEHLYPDWAKRFVAGGKGAVVLSAVLAFLAGTAMYAPGIMQRDISIVPLSSLIALAYTALLALALHWKPAVTFFSNRVLVSIGRVTFATYLLHMFVLSWVGDFIPHFPDPIISWWIGIIGAFITTVVLAKISWFLIESPMLSLRKFFHRHEVPSAAAAAQTQQELAVPIC
jgi:peptidoglycan/LPS O-acetylase OafA/YrhL